MHFRVKFDLFSFRNFLFVWHPSKGLKIDVLNHRGNNGNIVHKKTLFLGWIVDTIAVQG